MQEAALETFSLVFLGLCLSLLHQSIIIIIIIIVFSSNNNSRAQPPTINCYNDTLLRSDYIWFEYM